MYENRADHLSNNLRLNEISILIFFQFYCRINRNQLEIVVKATYGLHANKYFEILNLTFGGRSLVTRRFGLHSSSREADKIKDLLISIYFCNKNTELLLLFSIISPCFYKRIKKYASWRSILQFFPSEGTFPLFWNEHILCIYLIFQLYYWTVTCILHGS